VVEDAASSSKYARSGRKFKSEVYFGWFCDRFVFLSEKSDWSGRFFGTLVFYCRKGLGPVTLKVNNRNTPGTD